MEEEPNVGVAHHTEDDAGQEKWQVAQNLGGTHLGQGMCEISVRNRDIEANAGHADGDDGQDAAPDRDGWQRDHISEGVRRQLEVYEEISKAKVVVTDSFQHQPNSQCQLYGGLEAPCDAVGDHRQVLSPIEQVRLEHLVTPRPQQEEVGEGWNQGVQKDHRHDPQEEFSPFFCEIPASFLNCFL